MAGQIQLRRASNNNSQLYGDQASSDCVVQIGNVTIPAHRRILMAHSPAFRAMFSNPSAESSRGVVEISDFHPESVRAMIRYCYEGQIDTATLDKKWGKEVFQLADKYFIDGLKAQAEEHFIKRKLCVANVIEMALLADSHSAPKLMEACVKLFASEWKIVSGRFDWAELKRFRPELAADLLKKPEVLIVEADLSEKNVFKMVYFADTHSAPKLREKCVKFLCRKRWSIFDCADWKKLESVRPKLAADLRGRVKALIVKLETQDVTKKNVIKMALVADTYHVSKLKKKCVEVLHRERLTIYSSADWKKLESVRPGLAADLRINESWMRW